MRVNLRDDNQNFEFNDFNSVDLMSTPENVSLLANEHF